MADEEFDAYLASAVSELEEKQALLGASYGIGHFERFDVDFERCVLMFSDHGEVRVVTDIIPVSTHSPETGSLRWAWANSSLPLATREKALRVRGLYNVTGIEMFEAESTSCDESMAWEITALACKHLCTLGAYRMPSGKLHVHVLISAVRAAS